MKHFKILLFSISCILSIGLISSCGDSDADKTGKEYTSAYICPMHCEGSGSDKAGTCPVCKMDYVANENYKSAGQDTDGANHGAEGNHEGHDHSNHEGHNH